MSAKRELRGRAARLARLLPSGPSGRGQAAARTPFVLLVVLLLGGGLITLLLLNSSLNEGSFELNELRKRTTELTDEEQALQRDVDAYAAPDALQRRAAELGMVPGGDPAFLNPDGTVRGVPGAATGVPSALLRTSPPALPGAVPSAVPGTPDPYPVPSAAPSAPAATAPAAPVGPAPTTPGR